jgi:hypothetical protein
MVILMTIIYAICHIRKHEYINNIFNSMNTTISHPDDNISQILRAISTPVRIKILTAIGNGQPCVCHLETLLDLR